MLTLGTINFWIFNFDTNVVSGKGSARSWNYITPMANTNGGDDKF